MFTQTIAAPKSQQQLAQYLMQNRPDYASSQSTGEGLAKMAQELIGAWSGKKRMDSANKAMAEALQIGMGSPAGLDPKTGINWNQELKPDRDAMLSQLLMNPETADVGQGMVMNRMQSQWGLEDKIAEAKALLPLEIEKAIAIAKAKASGVAGGSKVMADALQLQEALGIDIGTAYSIAKSGMGMGRTWADGGIRAIQGAGDAAGEIKYGEKYGGAMGQNAADLIGKPKIAQAEASAKEVGKAQGEVKASLEAQTAQFPRLEQVVGELSDLGKKATYTYGGQAYDAALRQVGAPVPEGAIARKEYISKVDNEILPLLRQTFGAQFTQKEGESLKATLGDPNASPEEKDAVLRSFIAHKQAQIETLRRQTGQTEDAPKKTRLKYNPATGEFE